MNTPSHWLMTMAAAKFGKLNTPRFALGLGAVAPDIALGVLSIGGMIYYTRYLGWKTNETARYLFKDLFYNDPYWICFHNFLHSPTMLVMLILLTTLIVKFPPPDWRTGAARIANWFRWFFVACLFHALVDVVTHFDDGPLLFFPFNFTYRFSSPVSYWDTDHYGAQFMIFEAVLNLILALFLFRTFWNRQSVNQ